MSNFFGGLRRSNKDQPKRNVGNPLDDYGKLNFNDVMNDIYIIDDLREKGNFDGAKMAYDSFVRHGVQFKSSSPDVDNFLTYVSSISTINAAIDDKLIKTKVDDLDENGNVKLTDNDKLVSAIIIQEAGDRTPVELSYDTLTKVLDVSHGRQVKLTDVEFAQLSRSKSFTDSNTYKSITKFLVAEHPIPEVEHVRNIYNTDDLSDLYDEYAKDDYFKDNYAIKNIYAVSNNKQSAGASKQGSNRITLNSGTSNESLVKILSGGFKKPSQLAREAGVQMSGQMYGDAVYFARPDQISKNTAYLDRHNSGSKFIIVADIYYDEEVSVDRTGSNHDYKGRTMVHAHGVGRYSRDEYMCAPEQIEVKYVLEVGKGSLNKPKKPEHMKSHGRKSDVDDLNLDLDGLTDDKDIALD